MKRSIPAPFGTQGRSSPVIQAGASLKRAAVRHVGSIMRRAHFPGHPGRGLIEAIRVGARRRYSREQSSPVIQAGASLKRAAVRHMGSIMRPSPVIQAGASLKHVGEGGHQVEHVAFPGHPGRGLIEAPCAWRRRCGRPDSSPVIQAGASLKQRQLIGGVGHRGQPSPVIQAGASLKHCDGDGQLRRGLRGFPGHPGRGLIEAIGNLDMFGWDGDDLPRSSRPGPH